MDEKIKFNNCLICDSQEIYSLPEYENTHLVKCKKCSFVFSRLIPTEKELIEHYGTYQRNEILSPTTIKRYNELLDYFEKYRKTNKLLDIGSGIGHFLSEAKKRGWEVYGTEYTDTAIKICEDKDIVMKQGQLDESMFNENTFDVITSFEVIEHINNPMEDLSIINKILRKGGLVYVTTPNFNSIERYILKSNYNVISYPEHLSYYTSKTLNNLFKKNGFKKIKTETTGFSPSRFKSGIGVINTNNKKEVISDEKIRNFSESSFIGNLIKKSINFFLSSFNIGNALKGYYEKK